MSVPAPNRFETILAAIDTALAGHEQTMAEADKHLTPQVIALRTKRTAQDTEQRRAARARREQKSA